MTELAFVSPPTGIVFGVPVAACAIAIAGTLLDLALHGICRKSWLVKRVHQRSIVIDIAIREIPRRGDSHRLLLIAPETRRTTALFQTDRHRLLEIDACSPRRTTICRNILLLQPIVHQSMLTAFETWSEIVDGEMYWSGDLLLIAPQTGCATAYLFFQNITNWISSFASGSLVSPGKTRFLEVDERVADHQPGCLQIWWKLLLEKVVTRTRMKGCRHGYNKNELRFEAYTTEPDSLIQNQTHKLHENSVFGMFATKVT